MTPAPTPKPTSQETDFKNINFPVRVLTSSSPSMVTTTLPPTIAPAPTGASTPTPKPTGPTASPTDSPRPSPSPSGAPSDHLPSSMPTDSPAPTSVPSVESFLLFWINFIPKEIFHCSHYLLLPKFNEISSTFDSAPLYLNF